MPNGTLLYQWVLFMGAFLVLHFGIFKPTLHILAERKARTSGARESAETLQKKAAEILFLCEKKVEEARQLGIAHKNEKLTAGEKLREHLLKKVRGEIDQKMQAMRHQIEGESKQATMQLRQYSQEIARAIASKVLEREI